MHTLCYTMVIRCLHREHHGSFDSVGPWSDREIIGCLKYAADKLQIDDFHSEQKTILQCFLQGHDVFVNLPTGFGKSAIFHCLIQEPSKH